MSNIVLSAAVRQNLLSLQSTADMLATTQTDLATGKKVNSALDNPTNYFTAAGLDSRASDINNLLDSIGNGVQVLQAANTGITSLQSLVDSAKSIANQALQQPVGYTKASATSQASTGISANDLLGATDAVYNSKIGTQITNAATATYTSSVIASTTAVGTTTQAAYTNTTAAAGGQLYSAAATNATGTTLLSGLTDNAGVAAGVANNDTLIFGTGATAKTLTFQTGAAALAGSGTAYTLGIGTTLDDLTAAINTLQGTGATATDTGGKLTLSTGTDADLAVSGTALAKLGLSATAANTATRGGGAISHPVATTATLLSAGATGTNSLTSALADGNTITVNGKTITFSATDATSTDANGGTINLTTGTLGDVLSAIDDITGTATPSSVDANGKLLVQTGTTSDLILGGTGSALTALGLGTGSTTNRLATPAVAPAITGTTKLSGATGTDSLASGFTAGDTLAVTVGGVGNQTTTTIHFVASGATGNDVNVTDDIDTLLSKIDAITGASNNATGSQSDVVNGKVQIYSGVAGQVSLNGSSGVLQKLGLVGTSTGTVTIQPSTAANAGLSGQTLTIGATGNGTATSITFGSDDAAGQVSTLAELNSQLASNNLQASIDTSGRIILTTTNDAASSSIGQIGGTATDPGNIFSGATVTGPTADVNSQAARASLVSQYNNVIDQITTTAQDSSFSGVNLLNGDQLKLVFNETGTSTLSITGVNFGPAGLGLGPLTAGTDFSDNTSTNKILSSLNQASTTLRSEASALGSNLSVVQIRQDFNKNLINVLQTGSANLTLADTNEEAANSQALSTRQQIAVSALALANTSQQSVLRLLQ